jgi:hypothetical protein
MKRGDSGEVSDDQNRAGNEPLSQKGKGRGHES